jgi:hypothetical protein
MDDSRLPPHRFLRVMLLPAPLLHYVRLARSEAPGCASCGRPWPTHSTPVDPLPCDRLRERGGPGLFPPPDGDHARRGGVVGGHPPTRGTRHHAVALPRVPRVNATPALALTDVDHDDLPARPAAAARGRDRESVGKRATQQPRVSWPCLILAVLGKVLGKLEGAAGVAAPVTA